MKFLFDIKNIALPDKKYSPCMPPNIQPVADGKKHLLDWRDKCLTEKCVKSLNLLPWTSRVPTFMGIHSRPCI
jgi:hypothetical protein